MQKVYIKSCKNIYRYIQIKLNMQSRLILFSPKYGYIEKIYFLDSLCLVRQESITINIMFFTNVAHRFNKTTNLIIKRLEKEISNKLLFFVVKLLFRQTSFFVNKNNKIDFLFFLEHKYFLYSEIQLHQYFLICWKCYG